MTDTAKPTLVYAEKATLFAKIPDVTCVEYAGHMPKSVNDLMAETFSVLAQTGLTPRQLLEQRDEARAMALRWLHIAANVRDNPEAYRNDPHFDDWAHHDQATLAKCGKDV